MVFFSCSRLVEDEERRWTDENIDMVALKHFPNIDKEKAMSRPILYSNWLSKVIRSNKIMWEQLTDEALLPIFVFLVICIFHWIKLISEKFLL